MCGEIGEMHIIQEGLTPLEAVQAEHGSRGPELLALWSKGSPEGGY